MNERPTPETNAARHDLSDYGSPVPCSYGDWVPFEVAEKLERERDEAWACCDELVVDSNATTLAKTVMRLERERDEARELCRELIDLVAYGLGQSGQEWSLDAMRQAREKIQKAKSLEAK